MPDVTPPDPDITERHNQLVDRMTIARQQGLSWDTIHQSLSNRVQLARQAGVSDAAIQQSLGFNNPEELIAATQAEVEQHLGATQPTSWGAAFWHGLTNSSPAALMGVKPPDAPVVGHTANLIAGVTEAVTDLPVTLVGGMTGAVIGGVAGGGVGAVAGGGPEDVPADVAGAGVGSYFGAAAGATGAPALIKSARDRYAPALASGQVNGPKDYLRLYGQVQKDTVEAMGVGVATAGAGRVVSPLLTKMGAGKVTKFLGTVAAEAGTMATAQAALAGHMVTTEDLVDATVTTLAFHGAHAVAAPTIRAARARLLQEHVETGLPMKDIGTKVINDPVFRAKMLGVPDPSVPVGSSRNRLLTSTSLRPGTMPDLHTPLPSSNDFVVARQVGGFDTALAWMFREEGGLAYDTGGKTMWGISSKANPDLFEGGRVPSKEEAGEVYHQRYWRAIDADSLPPDMQLAAFDSAVNQGVGQTKVWLREAGGDLQAFMKLRIEKYAKLARDPKYAPYAKAWARRLRDLGAPADMADVIHRGPDNVGKEFSPEDQAALGTGGEGGPPKPPEPPSEPSFTPGDDGALARIMAHTAPEEGTDWWGKTVGGFRRIYGELFNPLHPVRRLIDTVMKGEPLDDYANPDLLFRVAENSNSVVQSAIKVGMSNLDGTTVTGHGLEDIVSGKSVGAKFSIADQSTFLKGYAVAKWAIMMDAQGKKTGLDIEDAKRTVADHEGQFGESFRHLVDWRNGTLKWLGEGGVHAQDKVDKLIADNESTIPGYRRMDDGSYKPVSTGKPGIWNPIKTAKGSKRPLEFILKSLMQDAFIRHELAVNNRAQAALADLAELGGAPVRRAVDINLVSAMDDLKDKGIDEDILSGIAQSTGRTIPKDEVPFFREGKLYSVKYDDPELTRVMRGFDQNARSTTMKIIGAITSIPWKLQTRYNPLFPVRLLTYDLLFQKNVNPDNLGPLANFYVGLGHMVGNSEHFQNWQRSGGADHIFAGLSKSDYIQSVLKGHEEQSLLDNVWNGLGIPGRALTAWMQLVTTPMRAGRYIRGMEQGESPLRAAVAGSEQAFHRAAYGGPVGKAWNTLVPGTLAHLNGLEKTTRAQLGIGSTITGVAYNAAKTTAKGAIFITMPAIASWWFHKDEDWYKAAPDYQKNNAWAWIPPMGGLPAIPIAAPPIVSLLYVAIPRMIMEAYYADNPHAMDHIWGTLGAGFMPPGGLSGASILAPILEHYTNHSFHRDSPLVSEHVVSGVQPAEQYSPYSSQAAKDLGQFSSDLPLVHSGGMSPIVIDNYISHWFGPFGRAAADAADAAIGRNHNSNPRPDTKVSDWPGIASWTERYPSATAAPIQQFYDTGTKLTQEHGSLLKALRDDDFERFKQIIDRGGASAAAYHQLNLGNNIPQGVDVSQFMRYLQQASQGADYRDMDLVRQATQALQHAHEYSMSVYENHRLSGQDKRRMLDETNATMQKMAERGNEAMDRALIGVSHRGAAASAPVPGSINFVPPQ